MKAFLPAIFFGMMLISHSAIAQISTARGPDTTVADNFTWTPWLSAGERVWGAVIRIEPKLKDVISDGRTVAVAISDLNWDGQNDIILYFWGPDQCGADGCTYLVLSNDGKTKQSYIGRRVTRQGHGLNVDGRYYVLR